MITNRRNFFQTLTAGAAGLGLTSLPFISRASNAPKQDNDDQLLQIGDNIAIAETKYGKVKGFILRGIYMYRGIPYGADTAGKNRFMPPQPPKPWTDTLPTVWWGNSAPQIMDNRYANTYSSFADHWNYDDVSEDCLKLNVWTPDIDSKKRPVLVWLHGGGYTNGNAVEQDGYDGENLCRKGNIVFVSINHRLGPIGFSDFSRAGGSKYADSGNVGALDMVASLEWVRDNIANFGGDPSNVTIIGQSGGGAKVCVLAAMPKAKGLLHKAIALSGNTTEAMNQNYSQKVGEYILKEAGLTAVEVDKLQEIPWKDYIVLANKAAQKATSEIGSPGMRGGFAPVADGISIPKEKFYSDPNGLSSDVPMLLCSTFHEWNTTRLSQEQENITLDKVKETLKTSARLGVSVADKVGEVVDAYVKAFPDAKPAEIMALVNSNRKNVIATANAKAIQKAPVYLAWFGWQPPLFDNRMRAFHCLDICFWFANTDVMLTHTGGGKRPRALSEKMSGTLIQFLKTGNPNNAGLPDWKKYTPAKGETMILNDQSMMKDDPDRDARKLI